MMNNTPPEVQRELNRFYNRIHYTDQPYDLSGAPTFDSVDSAFESIVMKRDTELLLPEVSTEEDLICNKNLHTATLFKGLSQKYNNISREIDICEVSKASLEDSQETLRKLMQNVTTIYEIYNGGQIEKVNTTYNEFIKVLKSSNATVITTHMAKKNALEIEQENLSRKLNKLRELIATGVKDLVTDESANKKMCPVCFDREVDTAMIPCGHTYCKGCTDFDRNNNQSKCPQCRTVIRSRIKLYFSV